jgi:hypothetical protein
MLTKENFKEILFKNGIEIDYNGEHRLPFHEKKYELAISIYDYGISIEYDTIYDIIEDLSTIACRFDIDNYVFNYFNYPLTIKDIIDNQEEILKIRNKGEIIEKTLRIVSDELNKYNTHLEITNVNDDIVKVATYSINNEYYCDIICEQVNNETYTLWLYKQGDNIKKKIFECNKLKDATSYLTSDTLKNDLY